MYDIIIIGAGVLGCSIARKLSFYDKKIAVIEKSSYICSGQSKANGAIIHGGHNSKPHTLKANFNVIGNQMFSDMCKDIGVEYIKTGLLVVAFNKKEIQVLKQLLVRGKKNKVKGLKILGKDELLKMEPNISPNAYGALFVPTAGIVDVHRLVIALAEHAAVNGVDFLLENEVIDVISEDDSIKGVLTKNGVFRAKIIINCAGTESGKIAKLAGLGDEYRIIPRKGEYYILDKKFKSLLRRPCFFTPDPNGKGITVFPTVNGNIIFGGNSVKVKNRYDYSTTEEGFQEVYIKAKKLVPGIFEKDIITAFSGIRSTSHTGDFIIDFLQNPWGLINLNGIDSPGLSSAPAIAEYVVKLLNDNCNDLKIDSGKEATYKIKPLFRDLNPKQKNLWIKNDPSFGRIICRCEEITEGDIVAAIHSPIPATTLDAIKFKTWTGAGRCQGSFDLERVFAVLQRECGILPQEIRKNEQNSEMVIGENKLI